MPLRLPQFSLSTSMENSATSGVCTQEEATSFSWTSSMDDLILFDTTTTTSDHHYDHSFSSSSCENYCSYASHGRAESSACSHRKLTTVEADDDLQDTATSSPHPAIPQMDRLRTKQKKQREMIITQAKKQKGKGSEFGEVEDRIEVGFVGRDNRSTGLKHIGLCLVPVSMVVNYFG